MISETYRLTKAILSIYSEPESNRRIPILVPSGATVVVKEGPLDGLRMVDVEWDDKLVMMFTVDLRERAALVKDARGRPVKP